MPSEIERFAFVTAYIMRKLQEADALTEEVMGSRWSVAVYRNPTQTPRRPWFRVSEDGRSWRQPIEMHYDLERPQSTRLAFRGVCNNLVHHFAFDVRQGAPDLEMLFNSWDTRDRLFAMSLGSYIKLVEEVHYDEITWVSLDPSKPHHEQVVQRRHRPSRA
ncbi:MAG: hypothetical protein WKF94_11940 [Solirubrobacteraceae bacterium]